MKDNNTLAELFKIKADEEKIVLTVVDPEMDFKGVARLTGRETNILVFKANEQHDLKAYIYLKDGSVVFADCDSKLSDLHKWMLPSIVEFLSDKGYDVGPTKLFEKCKGKNNKKLKNDREDRPYHGNDDITSRFMGYIEEANRNSALINGNTGFLATYLGNLSCQSSIDPRFGSDSEKRFFNIIKCWQDCNLPKKFELNDTTKPSIIKAKIDDNELTIDADTLELNASIGDSSFVKIVPKYRTAEVAGNEKLLCNPLFKGTVNQGKIDNIHYIVSLNNAPQNVDTDICNILRAYKGTIISIEAMKETVAPKQEEEKAPGEAVQYLAKNLGDWSQEFQGPAEDCKQPMPLLEPISLSPTARNTFSVPAPEADKSKSRFSEILVNLAKFNTRGRVLLKTPVTVKVDGLERQINEITPDENYDLSLQCVDGHKITLSYTYCPEAISEALIRYFDERSEGGVA